MNISRYIPFTIPELYYSHAKGIVLFFTLALSLLLTSCGEQSSQLSEIPVLTELPPTIHDTPPNTDSPVIGDGCDGCEIMYEGMPKFILSSDTSLGWYELGQKLCVNGKVFKKDGETPARDIIIYYWQTDNNGLYSPSDGMNEAAKRHGHLRGWVRTDIDGNYSICTIRPAPYPDRSDPAHIHLSVNEPFLSNEYYIDDFVFDDDPLLTESKRKTLENRGGSGILKVKSIGNVQIAEHNIILGMNIPNYPE